MSIRVNDCSDYKRIIYDAAVGAFTDLIVQGVHTKTLVACVYGLYQDYIITGGMEERIYTLVDPDELYNHPSEYWSELDENSDQAWQYIQSHIRERLEYERMQQFK